jgi:hypothetical protein
LAGAIDAPQHLHLRVAGSNDNGPESRSVAQVT